MFRFFRRSKKTLIMMVLSILLLPITSSMGVASDNVTLVSSRSNHCSSSSKGSGSDGCLEGLIEVRNIGYRKNVEVIWYSNYGSVPHTPATYVGPSKNGKELWSFRIDAPVIKFAIVYTVNGQSYIDDNNGNFYRPAPDVEDAILTYPDIILTISEGSGYYDIEQGVISSYLLVNKRNMTSKSVYVHYTDDSWKTVKETGAEYVSTYPSGVELWKFEAPIVMGAESASIEFVLKYSIGRNISWDDNYGNNYRISSSYRVVRGY